MLYSPGPEKTHVLAITCGSIYDLRLAIKLEKDWPKMMEASPFEVSLSNGQKPRRRFSSAFRPELSLERAKSAESIRI